MSDLSKLTKRELVTLAQQAEEASLEHAREAQLIRRELYRRQQPRTKEGK